VAVLSTALAARPRLWQQGLWREPNAPLIFKFETEHFLGFQADLLKADRQGFRI
jgi:hypothetical protein